MQFKDIPGLHSVKKIISAQIKNNSLPHALLFNGHENFSSLSFALASAQYLLCENKKDTDSCGECTACRKVNTLTHPDLHLTFPVLPKKSGDKPISNDFVYEFRKAVAENPYMNYTSWMNFINAENRQGNITVEECHTIIRNLNLKPFEAAYKVQLIWLPEYLGTAGNVLLKVLEEPSHKTIFILACENTDLVLSTIQSRCQHYQLGKAEVSEIENYLITINIASEEASRISRMSDGSISDALSLLNNETEINENLCLNWFRICFGIPGSGKTKALKSLQEFIDEIAGAGREKQKSFLKYCLFMLRESNRQKHTGESRLTDKEMAFAKHLSANISNEQLDEMRKLIEKLHYHVERNANAKIVFFNQTLKMADIIASPREV